MADKVGYYSLCRVLVTPKYLGSTLLPCEVVQTAHDKNLRIQILLPEISWYILFNTGSIPEWDLGLYMYEMHFKIIVNSNDLFVNNEMWSLASHKCFLEQLNQKTTYYTSSAMSHATKKISNEQFDYMIVWTWLYQCLCICKQLIDAWLHHIWALYY